MPLLRVLDTLETDRLVLRHAKESDAAIYRQLWTERDPRVPPHRLSTALENWSVSAVKSEHSTIGE